ncbi:MAG: SurA N-terminal domain-containing protein, partial [Candidatus Zixiibacteriota bacterium]
MRFTRTSKITGVPLTIVGLWLGLGGIEPDIRAGVEDAEPIERIVARVGNYPILVSELATQVQLLAMQSGFQSQDPDEINRFQEEVLRQLVNEKLFLIAAQQDTTLKVSAEEVEQALDKQIEQISGRFPTEQSFLDALAADGFTLRELRRKFYPEVESRLLKDRFIARKLSSINISRQEAREFYNEFRDSIPDQPAGVRLAHILLEFSSSRETIDSVKKVAAAVRKEVIGGKDFDRLVALNSAQPAGDLGYVRREEITPEFGNAAFALQVG